MSSDRPSADNSQQQRQVDDLSALANTTQEVYDRNAGRFDRQRSKTLFEKAWLDRFLDELPPGGDILDVGCGSGRPIAAYIASLGYRVTGLDFSNAMLTLARRHVPSMLCVLADMRTFDLDATFDGIIAWNSFFHLKPNDQPTALKQFSKHLKRNGCLMATVGPEASEVRGFVGDDVVYHASLSQEAYKTACDRYGLQLLELALSDPNCNGHSILLARKQTG